MKTNAIYRGAAAALLLSLGACSGDDGATGATGNVIGSSNSLPAEHPGNPAVTIASIIEPGSGSWTMTLNDQALVDFAGTSTVADTLVYDSDTDQWMVTINGTLVTLDETGGVYQAGTCTIGTNCTELDATQLSYSVLGALFQFGDGVTEFDAYGHTGLATPAANVPTLGTAVAYAGASAYSINYNDTFFDDPLGTPTIAVNFVTGVVSYDETIAATDGATTGELIVSSTATIDGNSYTGSVTGSFDPNTAAATDDGIIFDTGTLSGTFYGPSAEETAGVLSAADTDAVADANASVATGSIAGGFIAN